MAQTIQSPLPRRLTVEELRKFPGNENFSDTELDQQSLFLLEFSLIVYRVYHKISQSTDPHPDSICEQNMDNPIGSVKLAEVG